MDQGFLRLSTVLKSSILQTITLFLKNTSAKKLLSWLLNHFSLGIFLIVRVSTKLPSDAKNFQNFPEKLRQKKMTGSK